MPRMVKLAINPAFVPKTPQERAALDLEKKRKRPLEVAAISAQEAVFYSRGMFKIVAEDEKPSESRSLEDMSNDDLKTMMVQLGVKTEKQMKRSEIISLIRQRLDAIEVVDEEAA